MKLKRRCLGWMVCGLVFLLLQPSRAWGLEGTDADSGLGVLQAAREVAQDSGLLAASCPLRLQRTLPTYFRMKRMGADYVAETAIGIPLSISKAADLLTSVENYPKWLLVQSNGSPSLHEVRFDPETNKGTVKIRGGNGDPVEGWVTRQQDGRTRAVRLEMLTKGRLKAASAEVAALELEHCPEASLVTIRATWRLNMLARIFSGQRKWMPAIFVLAVRKDIVAYAIQNANTLQTALGAPVHQEADGWILDAAPAGGEGMDEWPGAGDSILRLDPTIVRLTDARRALYDRAMDDLTSRPTVSRLIATALQALSGHHTLVGYDLVVGSSSNPRSYVVGEKDWDMIFRISLEVSEEDYSLGLELGWPDS